jgi:exonuclease SbcC
VILKSLRLKNFKGLLAGVGLPEVVIDFDKLPDGLIALVGGNGMGKTTLLDNMHPYRLMPYKLRKAAGWSPGAFSYYDQCVGEARKELVFEMAGVTYKSVLLIDAERRKQEAYLYQDNYSGLPGSDVGWVPLNDGKTKTYDEAVEKVCGSPSLFFTSVFRSQGARNLSDYTRGDIMAIVAELLNIDHIREQGDKCKAVADQLLLERSEVSRKAGDLRLALADEDVVSLRLAGLRQELQALEAKLRSIDADLAANDEQLRKYEAAVASYVADLSRLDDKRRALTDLREQESSQRMETNRLVNDLTMDVSRVSAAGAQAVTRYNGELSAADRELSIAKERHSAGVTDLDLKVARCEKIKGGAGLIRDAVQTEERLVGAIAKHKLLLAEGRMVLEGYQGDRQKALMLKSKDEALQRRFTDLCNQADGMKVLACRADGSNWINESCPLLAGAVQAKNDAEAVRLEMEALTREIDPLRDHLDGSKVADATAVVRGREQALATDEAALLEAQKYTRLLPELEQAETQLVELATTRVRLDGDLAETQQRLNAKVEETQALLTEEQSSTSARVTELNDRIATLRADADQRLADLKGRILALAGEVQALDLALMDDPKVAADRVRAALAGLKEERSAAEASVRSLTGTIGGLDLKMADFGRLREQLVGIEAQLGSFDADIADWRLLQKACSNEGIIPLEIEDAGPSISAQGNDLLRNCYGPRFSFRIETQAEKRDGGAKEAFDITVFDAERDEQKSITEMSGGEVGWIEDAIVKGICLFNLGRSDRVFGTIFSDEKDGALDATKKKEFVAVKRRSLELGTHRREIFITQTSELVDLADGKIVLSRGCISVGE